MQITKHAMERYVERTMGKVNGEASVYIAQNEDKIKEQIQKLFDSASLLYEGRLKDHGCAQSLLNKNGWALVYDANGDSLITIYKVDCGLDDEFNQLYVDKYRSKILDMLKQLEIMSFDQLQKSEEIAQQIHSNDENISRLKAKIATLEKENRVNTELMQVGKEKTNQFEKDIKTEIEKFIGNPYFKIM